MENNVAEVKRRLQWTPGDMVKELKKTMDSLSDNHGKLIGVTEDEVAAIKTLQELFGQIREEDRITLNYFLIEIEGLKKRVAQLEEMAKTTS